MENDLSTMNSDYIEESQSNLRGKKPKIVVIRFNSQTQTKFGPITIKSQSYMASVFIFEIVSEKPVPFKVIKTRKSDMTIAFTF